MSENRRFLRRIILAEAADRYSAALALKHITDAERILAEAKLREVTEMDRENEWAWKAG